MANNKSEEPINSQVSAYLQRPLRTLKKAEQDNNAARYIVSMGSVEHGRGDSEVDHQVPQFPDADEHGKSRLEGVKTSLRGQGR